MLILLLEETAASTTPTTAITVQAPQLAAPPIPPRSFVYVALTAGNAPVPFSQWSKVIYGQAIAQPLQQAQITTPPLNPGQVETVPQAFLIQGRALPQPIPLPQVIAGWNPSVVETVPQSFIVQARNLPQPLQPAQVVPGWNPSAVETVPQAFLIQNRLIQIVPLPGLIIPSRQVTVVTAAPTPAILIQAAAIAVPLQRSTISLGLQAGTPPIVIYFATVIQGSSVAQRVFPSSHFPVRTPRVFTPPLVGGDKIRFGWPEEAWRQRNLIQPTQPAGINVYLMFDGSIKTDRTLTDWSQVKKAFYGGRSYEVSAAEIAALTAAGFTVA